MASNGPESPPAEASPSGGRATAWVALQSLVLGIVLTWPVALRPGSAVLGNPDADSMKHLWTLWWIRRTVAYDRDLPFHTLYVNYPEGLELWPIEPLNGLVAALAWPVSLVATANLLALLNLVLDGIFGALFVRELTGSRLAGHAGGLLLQASSFALYTLVVGVGELQHLWFLPLGMWCFLRMIRTGRLRWALYTGLALGLATACCFYHGFFLATALVVWGLGQLRPGRGAWGRLGRLALAAGVSAILVIPVIYGFSGSYGLDTTPDVSLTRYVWGQGYGQPVTDPVSARLQPEDLVLGRAWVREQGSRDLKAYGGGRLLGLPVLLLAGWAVIRRPRQALPQVAIGGVGILLATGSFLSSGGEELMWGGGRLAMPFFYLNRLLGYLGEPINFPVRFLALTHVAAATLGGVAVAAAPGRWRWGALALVLANGVDIHRRQLLPAPLPTFHLPDWSHLGQVAAHRGHGIVDLSVAWRSDAETRFAVMAAQMEHQHPVQAVPLERLEFFARDGTLLVASLKLVEDLEPAYLRQPVHVRRDYRSDVFVLREAGFQEVLITYQGGRQPVPPDLLVELEAVFGVPRVESPSAVLYTLPEVEATAEEQQTWRLEYQERLAQARRADSRLGPANPTAP